MEERDTALGERVGVGRIVARVALDGRLVRLQVVGQRVVVVGEREHVGCRLHGALAVDGTREAEQDVAVEVGLAALRGGVEACGKARLLVGKEVRVIGLLGVLLDGLVLAGGLSLEGLPVPVLGAVVEAAHEVAHVVHVLLVGLPVGAVELAGNFRIEGVDGTLVATLGQASGQPGPVHALVDGLVELRAGTTDAVGVETVLSVVGLKPLGGGKHVVGQADARRGPVHVHVDVELGGHHGIVETLGIADHGQLVAGALDPDARTVGLAGLDGLEDRGDVRGKPVAQTLVLGVAQTCVGLFLGHAQGMVGVMQAERLNNIVAGLDVAGTVLDDGAGLTDAAHEDVHDGVALRSLCGVDGLVGCHAQGNAGIRAALHVQLDGFFDFVGVKPAHLGGLLERPLGHVLLHNLERRTSLLAVGQRVGAEHLGVDGAV